VRDTSLCLNDGSNFDSTLDFVELALVSRGIGRTRGDDTVKKPMGASENVSGLVPAANTPAPPRLQPSQFGSLPT